MLIFIPEPEEDCFVPFASGSLTNPEAWANLEAEPVQQEPVCPPSGSFPHAPQEEARRMGLSETSSGSLANPEDRALRDRLPESVRDLRESPGEFLSAKLKEKRMTQVALARRMGLSETTISRMIKDHQPISAERACVMEGILGVPALDFVLTQASYELRMARFRAKKPGGTVRALLYDY